MSNAPKSILLVDDDEPIRMLLQRVLEPLPHHIDSAADGSEALERLKAHPFDLIISDLHMPKMDGLTLLKTLRAEGFDTAFIILTGYGDLSQALAVREMYNISNFLVKPIQHVDQFIFDVETALSRRVLEQENARLMNLMRQQNLELEARVRTRTQELTESNKKLQQLSTFRADILRVLGHELRTPLAILSGYFQLAWQGDSNHFATLAGRMGDSIGRLEDIVEKALQYLRHTETPHFTLDLERVDPLSLCRKVIGRLQPFLETRGITIQLNQGELPSDCFWDGQKLEEVVEELLINATRASEDGQEIILGVELQNVEDVLITITDQGCGVPEEDLERIFEPFVTLGEAVHHKSGMFEAGTAGTGLGLSLARLWVGLHQGHIRAHQPENGRGLNMLLLLPRQALDSTGKDSNPRQLAQSSSNRPS